MFARRHADIADNGGCDKSDIGNVAHRNRGKHKDARPSLPYGKQEYRARHVAGWAISVDGTPLCIPRRTAAQSRLNLPRQFSHQLIDALNSVDFGRLGQVSIASGRLYGTVSQPLLNVTDVDTRFQQVGRP